MKARENATGKRAAAWLAAGFACALALSSCAGAPERVGEGKRAGKEGTATMSFTNPLFPGADPWVLKKGDGYHQCWSANGAIYVSKSDSLLRRDSATPIWVSPASGWNCAEVWAPELLFLRGRWYIYYAADSGQNASHRMGVLRAVTDDPLGEWEDLGQLETGGRWAIDGTVLDLGGKLSFIWSGWPGIVDGRQNLYIASMSSPEKISGEPVLLSEPVLPWETMAMPIQEGPEVLSGKGVTLIVYSASGSWTRDYCLGGLVLTPGADPLVSASWRKLPDPLFREDGGVYGPGHASFTVSPDGTEDWIVYHAKTGTEHGWNRVVRAQPFSWEKGLPVFGKPVRDGAPLNLPSGEGH